MTMKKITFLGSIFLSLFSQAQTFTDNFDSYTAGSLLGPQSAGQWSTWSGAVGGTDDVLVSNADAFSGANSLHFVSTASTGGPSDVMRNFGVLNTGQFSMAFNMKVASGAAAYFNLQKTAVPGVTYALDAIFNDDGTLVFNQQAGFVANYPQGSWFNFRLDINFNTNKWEVFFDNVSQGSFSNSVNQIAAIDIFPVDNVTPFNANYFIDDFTTTVTPYVLPAVNAAVTYTSFDGANIAGNSVPVSFKVRNLGIGAVTSFDIAANYNGITENKSFTGLSMASLAEQSFTMTNNITLIAGSYPMIITLSNVNGVGADGDLTDNVGDLLVDPILPAAGKMVVTEEGTGTWCGWCVRGSVYMGLMTDKYHDYWAGIAVHNDDPMMDSIYNAGLAVTSFPTALVDRVAGIDPSAMEGSILTRLQIAPKALITNGATYDATTRTLHVSVSANFTSSATNAYKLACVLTEDGVHGTASGYNQANYYQGGGSGVMGGFELLANPVPASQMVYNHVARQIQPSFVGSAAAFPATIASGATHTMDYTFVLPATWDETKIDIIGMLIDGTGKVDNAGRATIAEAVTNGFVAGYEYVGVENLQTSQFDDVFTIYPNPATTSAMVTVNLKKESKVELRVIDMSGKEVAARNYGSMSGASTIQMNTSSLEAGMYLVELSINNEKTTKRLVIR